MYRYIIGTQEQCANMLKQIESIICVGYSQVLQTGDTYYIPIYSKDSGIIQYASISYDEFMAQYWQESQQEEDSQ